MARHRPSEPHQLLRPPGDESCLVMIQRSPHCEAVINCVNHARCLTKSPIAQRSHMGTRHGQRPMKGVEGHCIDRCQLGVVWTEVVADHIDPPHRFEIFDEGIPQ